MNSKFPTKEFIPTKTVISSFQSNSLCFYQCSTFPCIGKENKRSTNTHNFVNPFQKVCQTLSKQKVMVSCELCLCVSVHKKRKDSKRCNYNYLKWSSIGSFRTKSTVRMGDFPRKFVQSQLMAINWLKEIRLMKFALYFCPEVVFS